MAAVRRCSAESVAREESMFGTASTVRNWLLLEHPGPWGRDALLDARGPGGIGARLREGSRSARVRVLLIRRPGRSAGGSATCFAVHSGPDEPWIERIELTDLQDTGAIDVERLGRGEPPGRGEPHAGPLFLVCTHGRRDPCCAERGRPLAEALATAYPVETWESSHVGGDRFAGNLLAFPHGLYFGRVASEEGVPVARSYLQGRLDLGHLRGRSCHPWAVQAAEHVLREREGLDGIDDVRPEGGSITEVEAVVRFGTIAGGFEVRLALESSAEAALLTCHSAGEEHAPVYRTLSLVPV